MGAATPLLEGIVGDFTEELWTHAVIKLNQVVIKLLNKQNESLLDIMWSVHVEKSVSTAVFAKCAFFESSKIPPHATIMTF